MSTPDNLKSVNCAPAHPSLTPLPGVIAPAPALAAIRPPAAARSFGTAEQPFEWVPAWDLAACDLPSCSSLVESNGGASKNARSVPLLTGSSTRPPRQAPSRRSSVADHCGRSTLHAGLADARGWRDHNHSRGPVLPLRASAAQRGRRPPPPTSEAQRQARGARASRSGVHVAPAVNLHQRRVEATVDHEEIVARGDAFRSGVRLD